MWRNRVQWLSGTKGRLLAWSLVVAQLLLMFLLITVPAVSDAESLWPRPAVLTGLSFLLAVVGVAIMVASVARLGSGFTALPAPSAGARLQTSGIYRYVRHPLYTGLLLLVLGAVLSSGSIWRLLWALLLTVVLYIKVRVEEAQLNRRFGGYREYAQKTPRFLPQLRRRAVVDLTRTETKQISTKEPARRSAVHR